MNKLIIPFLPSTDIGFSELEVELDKVTAPQHIEHLLWASDEYMPDVSFKIAHNGQNIFLKYTVLEDHITAIYNNINDPVYKDTCVEFFISFGNDGNYYNLEFNRLGTCSVGYGSGKHNREEIAATAIAEIRTLSKTINVEYSDFLCGWELELIIPATIFIHHRAIDLNNLTAKANFFKCGDDLPQPHFLAWNDIRSDYPDFHQPQYFGDLLFAAK